MFRETYVGGANAPSKISPAFSVLYPLAVNGAAICLVNGDLHKVSELDSFGS